MAAILGAACIGCGKADSGSASFQAVGRQPDVAPVMLNKELPFRYPPALYAQQVQGNVTLRIFIDRAGQIVADSTHVVETSGFTALDSAAVRGSHDLRFLPARTQGQPVPVSILLPVFFRHPSAGPLPGDTILRKTGSASPSSTKPTEGKPADTIRKSAADSMPKAVAAAAPTRSKKTVQTRRTVKKAAPRRTSKSPSKRTTRRRTSR